MEFRKTTICIALERPRHNLEFLYKWVVVGGWVRNLFSNKLGRF